MFNRRISDDLATLQETEDRAVARAARAGRENAGQRGGRLCRRDERATARRSV